MNEFLHYEQTYGFRSQRITWGVQRLILTCAGVFAAQLLLEIPCGPSSPPGGVLVRLLAFQGDAFWAGMLWTPFTYMFLHVGLLHFFMNALWLFFFGPDVERALGTRQFIWFYLACGALGVLATLLPLSQGGVVVGASGAVMGVLVAYACLNKEREFFLFPFPVPINARALVLIIVALNVMMALSQGPAQGGGTSVATHFGGMAVGYAYMKLVPRMRRWLLERERERRERRIHKSMDDVGKVVNNIFRFEDEKRKRK